MVPGHRTLEKVSLTRYLLKYLQNLIEYIEVYHITGTVIQKVKLFNLILSVMLSTLSQVS